MSTPRPRRHPWYDLGWPILAGLVAAVGLAAAFRASGPAFVIGSIIALDLALSPMAWAIATETHRSRRWAMLELTPAVTLGIVVTVGLVSLLQLWALAVVAVTVLVSPLLCRERVWAGRVVDASRTSETRRAFDEIVRNSLEPTPEEDQDRGH